MQLPQQFGAYTLHELIARGGMAEVFRASMSGVGAFQKTVAIKKILPHLAADEEFVSMLIDEARIIVSINHANIAQVLDLGKIDDTYYIAMEFIQGIDLADILKDIERNNGQLPIEHTLWILRCILSGLHHAHNSSDQDGRPLNVVHRDVSPHNVLISLGGDVKIIDFGVAKARGMETTKAGVIKGKLLYMAPEQAMAKGVDSRADIFAAGVILYRMLTGHLPFQGDNEFQIYNNIMSREIPTPRSLNPNVTEEINQIAMMLLQRDPGKRYQDGYSAVVDLDRALQNVSPGYSVTRFSRYIEENFTHLLRRRHNESGMNEFGTPVTPNPIASETQDHPALTPMQFNRKAESPTFDDPFPVEARVAVHEPSAQSHAGPNMNQPNANRPDWRTQNPGLAQTGPIAPPKPQTIDTGKRQSALLPIVLTVFFWGATSGLIFYELQVKRTAAIPSDVSEVIPTEPTEKKVLEGTISFELNSTPKAVLEVNGEPMGETPITMQLPKSNEPKAMVLKAEGHKNLEFEFVPNDNLKKELELIPLDDGEDFEESEGEQPEETPKEEPAVKKPAKKASKKPAKRKRKKSTKRAKKKTTDVMILGEDPPAKKKKKKSEDSIDVFDL